MFSAEQILKWMYKLFQALTRLGFFWLMVGYFFWYINKQSSEPSAVMNVVWMLVAWGGTILHFANRIASKMIGRKVNILFELVKLPFKGSKPSEGVESTLRAVKEPFGVIYGREKGKYYNQDENAPGSVAVFGTPGSGKSAGVFIPTLLSYGSKSTDKPLYAQPSVFVVDIKGELLQASYKYRHDTLHRPIKYLAFNNEQIIDGVAPSKYNPFGIVDFVENDIQAMTEIASALIPMSKNESNPYFPQQARTLLAGLLYSIHQSKENFSFADTLQMICSVPIKSLIDTFCIGSGTQTEPECQKGWMLLSSFYAQACASDEAESFANIRDTMLGPLRLLATNDAIMSAFDTSYGTVITPQDLLEGDVFICVKQQYLDADAPNILNLIVAQFLSFFSRFENNTDKRILFMLDEFPRLGELKKVTEGINTMRSNGIRFMLAAQSIDQIKEKYGNEHFGVLMDGVATTLVLRAVGTSAEYFSHRIGKYDKTVKSKNGGVSSQSMQFGQGASSGTSESEQERDVFRPSFFENELASNKKIMIMMQDGYKVADVANFFDDKTFLARKG